MVVDGNPMFETLAIHFWLAGQYGVERGLWPREGTAERMQALSWSAWAYVSYGAVLVRLHLATQGDEALRSEVHAAVARSGLDQLLAVLNARLAAQPWMLGADYSLVDLIVGAVIGYSVYSGRRWHRTRMCRLGSHGFRRARPCN